MPPAPFHADLAQGPEGGRATWLQADDGLRLRMLLWPAQSKGRVLVLPGRGEYGEKYGPVASELARRGYGTVTLDWRGQGLSDRLLTDVQAGHVGDFYDYQRDLAAVLAALEAAGEPAPMFMIAHSMGGCIALRALMNGLQMRAVAFSAPMWGIDMSIRLRSAAWGLCTAAWLGRFSHSYVPGSGPGSWVLTQPFDTNSLTSDPEAYRWMVAQLVARPELGIGGPTLGWLNAALRETALLSLRPSPPIPAFTAVGTQETIVSVAAIHRRMTQWPGGRLEELPGARHEILMERPMVRQAFYDAATTLFDAGRPGAAPSG
ncbi:alpha/beta fold hydrolase [Plastorhodobacter daqingensis]|uniref:Alpha/beta fold hydrolase n=1 Tax=Plastorhodobacter daqingensis TaxID=1387281 RepID=A0ABW2UJ92_9RHOB